MALTRPNFENILTNTAIFTDSVTVLHGGATQANADIGFVFNRASGLVPNAAFYWSESTQSFITTLTANAGVNNANISVQSYANLTVGNLLLIQGSLIGVIGNISLGGVNAPTIGNTGAQGIFGNVNSANVIANTGVYSPAYFYSNGTPFVSSNYGNTQVLANLAAAGNPVTIGDNLYVGGNVQVTGAFVGNITLGTVPGSPNNLYTVAPLNLINSQSATLKTQLNLINTGGSGGAGSAIDFYTYTDQGNGLPGARFGAIDDNNYGATFQWFIKADGNTGNNSLQSVLSINQLGNVVIPGTTTSTSTTTGALVVAGGAGIGGNLYVGGNITSGPAAVSDTSNTVTSIGNTAVSIDSFSNTAIRSAKYVISTQDVTNSWSQATEILLAQDGSNVNIVTYGILYTGPSQRMTFLANITSGTVNLWATGVSTNNTVKLFRTAIPM